MVGRPKFLMALEGFKLIAQFIRLLIGLSSGAVILAATLIDRVFPNPSVRWALLLAIAGFAMCVMFSLGYFLKLVGMVMDEEAKTVNFDFPPDRRTTVLWQGALFSFFIGFGLFAFFVLWNLGIS